MCNPDSLRKLSDIAADIRQFWPNMPYYVKPYAYAMTQVDSIDDIYHSDDGETIVMYFLANAGTWRGPEARRIKDELRKHLASA